MNSIIEIKRIMNWGVVIKWDSIERNIDKAIECYRNSYLNESYEELCKLNVVY